MSCTASRTILFRTPLCVYPFLAWVDGRLRRAHARWAANPVLHATPGPLCFVRSVPNDGHCTTCCFPCAGWLPQVLCDPGFFSVAGQNTCSACPAGRFGSAGVWGLTTVSCSGACVGGRSVNVEGVAPCFGPSVPPRWVVRVCGMAVHDVRPHYFRSFRWGPRNLCAGAQLCAWRAGLCRWGCGGHCGKVS
jgi:hypothetical protein